MGTGSKHSQRFSKLFGLFIGLEENLVSEKPWYLQGEITADKRPVNSVLENVVHIDKNTLSNHQSFQITFEYTKILDDKIKERIVEMRFDNVIHTTQSSDTNEKKVYNADYKKVKIRSVALYDEAFELASQNNVFSKVNDSLNTKEKKKHKQFSR